VADDRLRRGGGDSKETSHFSKQGDGARLRFVHSNVPDRLAGLAGGWTEFHREPLKALLAKATA